MAEAASGPGREPARRRVGASTAPQPGGVPRRARIERGTGEVTVSVEVDFDGQGRAECDTGVPFLDHMLAQLAKHSRFDLTVRAKGDLEVDSHHTVEDTGIALGMALGEALGDKSGLRRFADSTVPLDEARARVAVDLSGRPYLVWDVSIEPGHGELGAFHPLHARHLLESVVAGARLTLHVVLEAGDLPHHCLEAIFKGIARALGDACSPDPRAGSGSTKGTLG